MTADQAETQIAALIDAFQNFPTKDEMQEMENNLRTEMHEMESRLENKIDAVENKVDKIETSLNGRIDKLEMKLTIKLGGMLVVAIGLVAVLVKLL